MFIPTITGSSQTKELFNVNVDFSNGTDTFSDTFKAQTQQELKQIIKNRVDTLNKIETLKPIIANGVVDISDTPLTQPQIDERDWFLLYNKWIVVKTKLIDTGILTGNETQIVSLKSQVQNGFKAAYLNNI